MQITIREPGNALTHFIAMMLAVFASMPLLLKAGLTSGTRNMAAMTVFMISMILLYGASTMYHSVNLTGSKLKFFKISRFSFETFTCLNTICGVLISL